MAQSSRNCYCSVPYCSNNKQKFPYMSFHDFPVDAKMRARWVKAIKRDEGPSFKIVRASTFVCRQHFTPADIYTTVSGRIRIKQGAVPSRFYWNGWGQGSPAPESVNQRASSTVDDDSEKKLVLGESTEEALRADAVTNDHDYASHSFSAYHPPEAAAPQTRRALPSPQPRLTKYFSVDSTSVGSLPEVHKKPISSKEEANHPPEEAAPQTSGVVLRTQPQLFTYYLTGPVPGANIKPITVKEEDKLDIATLRIKELELQVVSLENEIQQLTVNRQQPLIDRFCTTDEDFHYYTRFSSKEVFAGFWESVYPSASRLVYWTKVQKFHLARSRQKKLPLIDEFFMFLCRVAAGLPEKTLSSIFGVSLSTVNSTISTWTIYLYQVLGSLPVWMTKEQVQATMPHKFKLSCPHARVIIKSTEIHCETASSTSLQLETSDNKTYTTFKGLIGIAPCGVITFVSKLHTDSISDTEITRRSHILQLLEPGDGVMADSGFLIEEMLSKVGATLIAPPLEKATQLTKEDSCNTQVIPSLRILVERAICRVKEYSIWDGPVPLSMASSVNELWVVCCLMSSYQRPLDIKGNKLV